MTDWVIHVVVERNWPFHHPTKATSDYRRRWGVQGRTRQGCHPHTREDIQRFRNWVQFRTFRSSSWPSDESLLVYKSIGRCAHPSIGLKERPPWGHDGPAFLYSKKKKKKTEGVDLLTWTCKYVPPSLVRPPRIMLKERLLSKKKSTKTSSSWCPESNNEMHRPNGSALTTN